MIAHVQEGYVGPFELRENPAAAHKGNVPNVRPEKFRPREIHNVILKIDGRNADLLPAATLLQEKFHGLSPNLSRRAAFVNVKYPFELVSVKARLDDLAILIFGIEPYQPERPAFGRTWTE